MSTMEVNTAELPNERANHKSPDIVCSFYGAS